MKILGRKTVVFSVFNDRGVRKGKLLLSDGRGNVLGIIKPV